VTRVASEAVQGAVKKGGRRLAVDDLPSWQRKVIGPSVNVWLPVVLALSSGLIRRQGADPMCERG
jgi:hypothetical protein